MGVHDEMNTMYANINRLRAAIAWLLRAMADAIEPVRTIEWGTGVADAPITVGEPIKVPCEWLDWPGKEPVFRRPPLIFYGDQELPRDQLACRAKLDGSLPPGCMLQDREEDR